MTKVKRVLSHVPAQVVLKGTGINRATFYQRVNLREIGYIEPFNSERLYSVADWNEKSPDYKLNVDKLT